MTKQQQEISRKFKEKFDRYIRKKSDSFPRESLHSKLQLSSFDSLLFDYTLLGTSFMGHSYYVPIYDMCRGEITSAAVFVIKSSKKNICDTDGEILCSYIITPNHLYTMDDEECFMTVERFMIWHLEGINVSDTYRHTYYSLLNGGRRWTQIRNDTSALIF